MFICSSFSCTLQKQKKLWYKMMVVCVLGMVTLFFVKPHMIINYSTDPNATHKRDIQDYTKRNKSSEGNSIISESFMEALDDKRTPLAFKIKFEHEVSSVNISDRTYNTGELHNKTLEVNNRSRNVLYPKEKRYLINNPTCRIPYFDPYDASIVDALKQLKTPRCPPREILTYVIKDELFINWTAALLPPFKGTIHYCSYVEIFRPKNKKTHHDFVSLSGESYRFNNSIKVQQDFISVSCFNKDGTKAYDNVHFFIIRKNISNDKFRNPLTMRNITERLNVIVLGLDTMSRLAFTRHMKKTRHYLLNTLEAFEMTGYNKVADNTFPNVVPLTTGKHVSELMWSENKTFDNLDFIWKQFSHSGFTTLYSEDRPEWGNFDLYRQGLARPPTDYFDRPLMIAMRLLKNVWSDNGCFLNKLPTQLLLDYLHTFLEVYNRNNFFAFSWNIGLGHTTVYSPEAGDVHYYSFLRQIEKNVLNNSVLFVVGDHGTRMGKIREQLIGGYEDRLPVLFLYVPKWFKVKYPYIMESLKTNQKRLTSPFDVYETFRDILFLNGQKKTKQFSRGISLFQKIPLNRTCEDAGINLHWCACRDGSKLTPRASVVVKAATALVKAINKFFEPVYPLCETYTLRKIVAAESFTEFTDDVNTDGRWKTKAILLQIATAPGTAIFEATVKDDQGNGHYTRVGGQHDISRLTLYGQESECVQDPNLKPFCLCKSFMIP